MPDPEQVPMIPAIPKSRAESAESEWDEAQADYERMVLIAAEERGHTLRANKLHEQALEQVERLREALAETAIPLEVLYSDGPRWLTGPLRRRYEKLISPELWAQIQKSVLAARAALTTSDKRTDDG